MAKEAACEGAVEGGGESPRGGRVFLCLLALSLLWGCAEGDALQVKGVSIADCSTQGVLLGLDETHALHVSFEPDNAEDKAVQWTSSNVSVATVDKNGLVRGIAEGVAMIEVATQDGKRTDVCFFSIDDGRTRERPILVSKDNMEAFNKYANTENGRGKHYQLTGNVTLPTHRNNWTAIGTEESPFTGSLDGGGFSISGLNIALPDGDFQGLFGYIASGAIVENLGLLGGSVSGNNIVGGVVGVNDDGVVQHCYTTGSVSGNNWVGGVVALNYNGGLVQNCYATGNINGNEDISDSENISESVGGVVGHNLGGIVQNGYATGNIRGSVGVGGVVGSNVENSTVQNGYATGSIRGFAAVGGVVGYSIGTVQNSVALNPSVRQTADEESIGRVVGYVNERTTLLNNHARKMTLTYSSGNSDYAPQSHPNSKDGQTMPEYETRNFWEGTARWDFTTVWKWGSHNLPVLRDVGGQPP